MKRIYKIAAVAAIVAAAGFTAYNAQNKKVQMSSLEMENVEAIANGESSYHITCYYSSAGSSFRCKCGSCAWGYIGTSNKSTCY